MKGENLMLKYPCACLNCENKIAGGRCSVSSTSCKSARTSQTCPVTKCLMFVPKKEFTKTPCRYFENIENGGLKIA